MKDENQRYAAAKAELKAVLADERRIDFKGAAITGFKILMALLVAFTVYCFAIMGAAFTARIFPLSVLYLVLAAVTYSVGVKGKFDYFKLIGKMFAICSCLGFVLGIIGGRFLGKEVNDLVFLGWAGYTIWVITQVAYIKYPLLKFECWQKAKALNRR